MLLIRNYSGCHGAQRNLHGTLGSVPKLQPNECFQKPGAHSKGLQVSRRLVGGDVVTSAYTHIYLYIHIASNRVVRFQGFPFWESA